MRRVGLDLGARHIAFCEVTDGQVVHRTSVRRLGELEPLLGPKTATAQVAFEACREGWHVHDVLVGWGQQPVMLDTTRVRQIGVGQHGRKNDALDAEAMALALDAGRVPMAHVLSPERRALRARLSVRGELVETRARHVTVLRIGPRIGCAGGQPEHRPLSAGEAHEAPLMRRARATMALLVATPDGDAEQLAAVDKEIAQVAKGGPNHPSLRDGSGSGPHRVSDLRFGDRRGEAVSQRTRGFGVLGVGAGREHDRRQAPLGKHHHAAATRTPARCWCSRPGRSCERAMPTIRCVAGRTRLAKTRGLAPGVLAPPAASRPRKPHGCPMNGGQSER